MTGAQIERKRREAKAASGSNYRGPRLPKDEYTQWKEILSTLDLSRSSLKVAMGFAFNNIEFAIEIVEMLKNRLILEKEHSAAVKVAGLFLLSDILHNSALPIKHATDFK
jgi:U2-associated protein SR140